MTDTAKPADELDVDRIEADYRVDSPAGPGSLPGDIGRLCEEVRRLRRENGALRARTLGEAVDNVDNLAAAIDRARRARNIAAARLAGKVSLSVLAELAGVSRERVRQWAAEGSEGQGR